NICCSILISLHLLCGGLAGSTAALFITPFDVIPKSLSKYASVSHTHHEISKREGLKGLYRRLTPRIVMYVRSLV
ncbi:hypothetical protein GIB67_022752, partial [Kingdonia uniflora]